VVITKFGKFLKLVLLVYFDLLPDFVLAQVLGLTTKRDQIVFDTPLNVKSLLAVELMLAFL